MITKINLNKVASYKSPAALETDKKVNLIYGLNGTGKSTLSNYLYQRTDEKYKNCSVEGLNDTHEILVYNQTFIQENFFEADNLKGIFTLSKENKDAETNITDALKEIASLKNEEETKSKELETEKSSINQKQNAAKETVWKIKTDYSGGDRVLEFCLDGYKGSKDNLYNHIISLTKPTAKPAKNINDLKSDFQSISGDNDQKHTTASQITFSSQSLETETLFNKQIVGNENSTVSQLIKELGNSDWVKTGLQYLQEVQTQKNSACPFCQEKTISNTLVESIKDYFDVAYERDINSLKSFLDEYRQAIQEIPNKSTFEVNPEFDAYKKDFEIKYSAFLNVINDNKKLIDDKIKTPSVSITLNSSVKALEELNEVISKVNLLVAEHNKNIDQKETVKGTIKKTFWEIMRWDYDQTISSINADKSTSKSKIEALEKSIKENSTKITTQNLIIFEQQRHTKNIDEAVENIKNGLVDLGITDFEIKKHSDNLYKIVRGENEDKVFRTLSEGEKMIITFLYFLETCRGNKEIAETGKKNIIVIDDPISSLSHIYVFNVGRLIKNEFFGKKETKKEKETGVKIVEWKYKCG
jgi:wobble nucleotide-excising tRNase